MNCELRGAEELLDRGRHRLGVDQFLRHQAFGLRQVRRSLTARSTRTRPTRNCVLGHLADRTHAAVAEVVDVVDRALAVADVDQHLQHVDDVIVVRHAVVEPPGLPCGRRGG
jgi:hypothetical protein